MTSRPTLSRSRGFTVLELLISLSAGLVVALGVFALSKAATASFQEEQRVTGAETTLRAAMDRIRADIQRAGFMSTGNLRLDPMITESLSGGVSSRTSSTYARVKALGTLRLQRGGSSTTYASNNGLSPDTLYLAGNFTTVDQFVVRAVDPLGTCTRVWLADDSPAMWRIKAAGDAKDSVLQHVFRPIDSDDAHPFIARVMDDTGRAQFLPTCITSTTVAAFSGGVNPYVDLQGTLITSEATATVGGASGLGVGRLSINPVQWVRWSLVENPGTGYAGLQSLATGDAGTGDVAKYYLVRSWIDANDEVAGDPEVVAEYVVDMKFAFTVDASTASDGSLPLVRSLTFDDADNEAKWGFDVATTTPVAAQGPQRIRSVRVRLATRAAIADREANIASAEGGTFYPTRYCLGSSPTNCKQWARMRSLTTEIAMPNQARMFY